MKIFEAKYLIGRGLRSPYEIEECFEFELDKYDDWERIDNRYARHNGWFHDYIKDEIDVNNNLCYAVNIKYFEHDLIDKELKELKQRMQLECIKALELKRDKSYKDLTTQINFIKSKMDK